MMFEFVIDAIKAKKKSTISPRVSK